MKFCVHKALTTAKEVDVYYAWSGSNLHVRVGYMLSNNVPVEAGVCFHWEGKKTWLDIHFSGPRGYFLAISLRPETVKEERLLRRCWVLQQSADYCDTHIVLIPAITARKWETFQTAKQVPREKPKRKRSL